MERTLPRPLTWQLAGVPLLLVPVLAISLIFSLPHIYLFAISPDAWGSDWRLLTEAGWRITQGLDPYAHGVGDYNYKWSPLAAYVIAVIAPLGHQLTAVLVLVAMFAVDRRIGLVWLFAWPLWVDLWSGLSFAFIPLTAVAAVKGSQTASLAWVALSVLIPRPMMLPVLGWLLVTRPALRLPALLVAAACLGGSFATGWGGEWMARLTEVVAGGDSFALLAPGQWLGVAWWPVAIAASAGLAWQGRLGLASLVMSPYILIGYLQMLVLELAPLRRDRHVHAEDFVLARTVHRPRLAGHGDG
jgi:hypothetical protein